MDFADLPNIPANLAAQGMVLRPAVEADAGFLHALYVAGRWDEMASVGWPEAAILDFLADQFRLQTIHYQRHYADALRLILECRGEAQGGLLLLPGPSELRVVDIGVMPACRGQGIGTSLMRWVQGMAREAGHGQVSLHVEPNNPAKRLYLRLGFRVTEPCGAYERMDWSAPEPVN